MATNISGVEDIVSLAQTAIDNFGKLSYTCLLASITALTLFDC
jgi:hypothetical protein